jgi:hypothetical protein
VKNYPFYLENPINVRILAYMNKRDISRLINQYFDKIITHYGESKFQMESPWLVIEDSPYSDADDKDLIGEYCSLNNELIIYWKNIKNTEDLVRTLIHEYQHYLQSPSWMTRYYKMGYDYHNHPYETIAYERETDYKLFI